MSGGYGPGEQGTPLRKAHHTNKVWKEERNKKYNQLNARIGQLEGQVSAELSKVAEQK